MKTDELIKRLAQAGPPTSVNRSYVSRFLSWMAGAVLCTFVGVATFGFRPDLHERALIGSFLFQGGVLLTASVLSALAAFAFSVPGEGKPSRVWLALTSLFLWIAFLFVSLFTSGNFIAGAGYSCIRDIVVLGLIPGFSLFLMIRAAAPLKPSLTGILGALAVSGLGALGTQFICKNDNPLHIILWHFLPIVVLASCAAALGRFLLRTK